MCNCDNVIIVNYQVIIASCAGICNLVELDMNNVSHLLTYLTEAK